MVSSLSWAAWAIEATAASAANMGAGLLLAPRARGLVAQLVGMVDRGYPGLGRIQGGGLTFTMHGNACLQACGLGNCLGQLRLGVLDDGVELAALKEDTAGFVNLDEVCPVL